MSVGCPVGGLLAFFDVDVIVMGVLWGRGCDGAGVPVAGCRPAALADWFLVFCFFLRDRSVRDRVYTG